MIPRFHLDDALWGGPQPDRKGLEKLAKQGFRSILNLSAEGEEGAPLSPNVEASWAHALALEHGRLSVFVDDLLPDLVERFRVIVAGLPRPLYVESVHGRRAAAFLTIELARRRKLDAEAALTAARAMGMDCELEELRRFVRAEIERGNPVGVATSSSSGLLS